MLPSTLQFVIAMIASAINERMQRKLDYTQEEVRVVSQNWIEGTVSVPGRPVKTLHSRRPDQRVLRERTEGPH